MTLTVDLIDSDALGLLEDMERRNLIRVNPPEKTAPPEAEKTAAGCSTTRIGFLKGRVSVPADFDTMGQEEISSLFTGNS
ncbi:MAG: hypothetical protein LBB78_06790 [Spirochaetaceae bacterium]|jgi:hypothetical protein|nr:hypothetical protein [Spirochaetaceae bacterium]